MCPGQIPPVPHHNCTHMALKSFHLFHPKRCTLISSQFIVHKQTKLLQPVLSLHPRNRTGRPPPPPQNKVELPRPDIWTGYTFPNADISGMHAMLLTGALPSPEGCSATSTPRAALHHGPHSLSKCSCSAPNTAPLTMNYSHMHNKISTNELCCVVTHKNAQNTTAHTRCTLAGAFVLSGLPWCSDYCAVFLTNQD